MALVGAGRMAEAEAMVARLEGFVTEDSTDPDAGSNLAMTSEVGLPASRAVVAFGQGRWDDAVAELAPIRRQLQLFGGSHAQRDVLQRTLSEARPPRRPHRPGPRPHLRAPGRPPHQRLRPGPTRAPLAPKLRRLSGFNPTTVSASVESLRAHDETLIQTPTR